MGLASSVGYGLEGPAGRVTILKAIAKNTLRWVRSCLRPSQIEPYELVDGPGRSSGNRLSVFIDGLILTEDRAFLCKAEKLICLCVHPREELERRQLADVNVRWSYTVFLQAMGEYLCVKAKLGDMDYMYHYAKESVLRYATWMERNERPFLDRPQLIDFPNYAT